MNVRNLRMEKAFSLIEVMVGTVFSGITFFALYSGMTYCNSNLQFSRENLRATEIMVGKLEAIRLYSWDQVNDPAFLPRTFVANYVATPPGGSVTSGITYQGSVVITNAAVVSNYSDKLRLVTINLTWKTGNTTRHRSMQSLVAFTGLYNYVF